MRMLIAAILGVLALVPAAEAQSGAQYGQITCTAGATGGVPATCTVQRAPAGTTTWTSVSPALPMTGTPAVSAPFTDTTRVSGTAYQYRGMLTNAGGSTPTAPSASFTFVDAVVGAPGVGAVGVVIITQPPPAGQAPASQKAVPKKK